MIPARFARRPRRVSREATLRTALLAALAVPVPSFGQEVAYEFIVNEVEALPGETASVTVEGRHPQAVQGFSFAARFPPGRLAVERVHTGDTILEAIDTDWFEARVDPGAGHITVGALVDARPPFEGGRIPAIGQPLVFFTVEARVLEGTREDAEIAVEDGLGSPPVDNVFVVDDQPVGVDRYTTGGVRLPWREVPAFLRGDATLDGTLDVSDAIRVLDWRFRGGPAPACVDAADANDDRSVDVSDAIALLHHLFGDGAPLPPPSGGPGPDPTEDDLGCAEPLAVRRVLAQ